MAYLRDRRAFGNIGTRKFRGARFGDALSPRFSGLLDQYGGAAAAYSLRALSSGWLAGDVVRVRRESDNGERNFNASGVSSGELVNWVNQQITPPLDLRELTATGRDGAIIEAAAAYSLRNLSDSYAGSVVEVRRNTDGALKDFKASEVTDGTLAAWVNTSFANALPLDTAGAAAAAYSLRNLSSSYAGSVVEVRRSSDGALRSFTAAEVTDGTLVAWVGAGNDGTVSKWYDQMGGHNNATQGTPASQPKIVNAGVLVTNAEGNPAIQGATGKSFDVSPITGLEDVSIFFVGEAPSFFQAITGWDTNLHMIRFSSSTWEFAANTTDAGNMDWNSALTSGDTALFNFTRSSGTVTGYANSVASDTTSNANSNTFGLNRIFTRSNVNYNDYEGKASELIIYPSDQSANRLAIEANINNQYEIY
jgi:hypothetical protein